MRRRWVPCGWPVAVALMLSCAKKHEQQLEGVGLRDATDAPGPGMVAPVRGTDFVGLAARGRLIYDMERALKLGYEQGVFMVGHSEQEVVIPFVEVDPGGRSGQVLFFRWSKAKAPALRPHEAERWLLVSLLLRPDRVLDVEMLRGDVVKHSEEAQRLTVLLAAAQVLQPRYPGRMFHLFVVAEGDLRNASGGSRARVYAMSASDNGPDLELLFEWPKRNHPAPLVEDVLVHEPSDDGAWHVHTAVLRPQTVARVMLRGPDAGWTNVTVGEQKLRIDAASGSIEEQPVP